MTEYPAANLDTAEAMALAVYNASLDAALRARVALHRWRKSGAIGVPAYLAGLAAVRNVEAALEPYRGQAASRASEWTVRQEAASR